MIRKNILNGTLVSVIGFLLSPLSWWNDLIFNIPLAYIFASVFGIFSKKLMLPMFILGYWLTNIAGLLMMHTGMKKIFIKDVLKDERSTKKEIIKNLIISLIYTGIISLLFLSGYLKFPTEYLNR